ncbi:hypothetical protein CHUAL_000005 [Chamberlinius hualienensis]
MQTNLTSALCVGTVKVTSDDRLNGIGNDDVGILGTISSVLLLLICLTSNITCIKTMRKRKCLQNCNEHGFHDFHHGYGNNVIDMVSVICVASVINGSSNCFSQIVSFLIGRWSFGYHACKAHGFFSNFMSLIIVWYTALLGLERYFKFVNGAEYNVTFTRTNVQLIMFGIACIILSVVAGPIYGWGDYVYKNEIRTCIFDVKSRNATTYYIMTSIVYLLVPYITMAYCCITVSLYGSNKNSGGQVNSGHSLNSSSSSTHLEDKQTSDHYDSKKFIFPLTVSIVFSFLLQLPTHVISINQLMRPDWTCSSGLLFTAAWLNIFATNCCLSTAVLTCNIRRKPRISSDLIACCPWWHSMSTASECDDFSTTRDPIEKPKSASYTCKLCLQFHIIKRQ